MPIPHIQSVVNVELPYTQKSDRFSSHARIAAAVLKHRGMDHGASQVVLDVGCAYGFLRTYLPSPHFYLIGIDVNEVAVEKARKTYDEVYQVDIASPLQPSLRVIPDVIVFGDVLEHLPDPLGTLQAMLVKYAQPRTQVIVSLPNVAHLFVRLRLMLGRFDYTDRGLLDRTHLRFFTLRTARQMLEAAGLRVVSVDSTPIPLPLIYPAFGEGRALYPLHVANNMVTRLFRTLLSYQFILEACYDDK